ncbi:MAG: glycosyltransferase, partial [Paracoccaceae bacterium]
MPPALSRLRLVTPDFVPVSGLSDRRRPGEAPRSRPERKPLGQILLDMKAVDPGNLLKAVAMRGRQDVRLGDILLAHGWVRETDLMTALSLQWGARVLDLATEPPDPRLIDAFGPELCLSEAVIPWRKAGAVTVVATARPEQFARLRDRLPAGTGPVVMALAGEKAIHAAMLAARQTSLIRRAETRVTPHESCRTLTGRFAGRAALAGAALLAGLAVLSPSAAFVPLFAWAVLSLVLCSGLKAAAFVSQLRAARRNETPSRAVARLPVVSVMVPLFHETDIAPRLIRRLGRLDYPKELLDILLVVEEDDRQTRAALAARQLPHWMRVVTVPHGPIRTKPRALNYALDFCRGSIIGVYDAEDAPEPDQLHRIVRRFHEAGPEVACLQGVLDFYNARHNWLTRCFAAEYAAWFRVVLPGIARMGLVVPLGGTTLFFRRELLEELGGWDAHNVTEDADLGLRLARHGYRTELVPTVTEEEPNGRALPWIRQRSRWLKGYAMTWAVHMRDPVRLWRELGPKRFFGVQVMFLGTLSQFVLAPVLWSCWALTLGLSHPLQGVMPQWALLALNGVFVLSELLNIAVGAWACRGPRHRHLIPWVPTLHFYFPLGALASYKALWEAVRQPFYWDKTSHGVLDATAEPPEPADEAPADLPVLVL